MVTFEELTQKYPVQNVAPYGECVVVPGAEFDPDWEVALGDKGCICHFIDLDQRPVVLVQRKDARSNEDERIVYAPQDREDFGVKMKHSNKVVQFAQQLASQTDPAYSLRDIAGEIEKKFGLKVSHVAIAKWIEPEKSGGEKSMESKEDKKKFRGFRQGSDWTAEENERLLKRMQELTGYIKDRAKQLVSEFPGRNANGIEQKYKKLLRAQRGARKDKQREEKTVGPFFSKVEKVESVEERLSRLEDIVDTLQKVAEELQAQFYPCQKFTVEINDKVAILRKGLAEHKHAVSGEAMLPMEGSE